MSGPSNGRSARRQRALGLTKTQLRERLNQLQELHILPEHRVQPDLNSESCDRHPPRPSGVSTAQYRRGSRSIPKKRGRQSRRRGLRRSAVPVRSPEASWTAFTPEEWDAISAHVHAADFFKNAYKRSVSCLPSFHGQTRDQNRLRNGTV